MVQSDADEQLLIYIPFREVRRVPYWRYTALAADLLSLTAIVRCIGSAPCRRSRSRVSRSRPPATVSRARPCASARMRYACPRGARRANADGMLVSAFAFPQGAARRR